MCVCVGGGGGGGGAPSDFKATLLTDFLLSDFFAKILLISNFLAKILLISNFSANIGVLLASKNPSSKSLISFIFHNDHFARFYAIVGKRKKYDG